MASLDSLPADQRAVLQLVLQRGYGYDDIARLLSIDRAAVRTRALAAFDTLGPQTGVPDQRRALITDYLLGQLPEKVREQTRDRLAGSASERSWARVMASELAPLASGPLPEIPSEASRESGFAPDDRASAGGFAPAPAPPESGLEPVVPDVSDAGPGTAKGSKRGSRPSSRRGGLLLLLLLAVVVVVVLVVVLAGSSGGSSHKPKVASSSGSSAASSSTSTGSATSSSSTASHVIAQINLTPPAAGSKAAGIAEILKQGAADGLAIVAQNVTPNTTKPPNAYAVWLYNSPADAHILGFVNPGVGVNGRLSTAGGLPANAAHYKQLIVTVETQASPKQPGTVILQGTLTGL